mmetsp:Transcript_47137/g.145379  ORF Transcript_47137/g.145379 Transcript_47137/m.145379 type:complete len:205 (+) Transcript_47137:877-1491(+)
MRRRADVNAGSAGEFELVVVAPVGAETLHFRRQPRWLGRRRRRAGARIDRIQIEVCVVPLPAAGLCPVALGGGRRPREPSSGCRWRGLSVFGSGRHQRRRRIDPQRGRVRRCGCKQGHFPAGCDAAHTTFAKCVRGVDGLWRPVGTWRTLVRGNRFVEVGMRNDQVKRGCLSRERFSGACFAQLAKAIVNIARVGWGDAHRCGP